MATTAIAVVTVEILDAVPQIASMHPWLFTNWWLSFGDVLRDPIALDQMTQGLLVNAAYVVVFGTLAWARLTTRDVTS